MAFQLESGQRFRSQVLATIVLGAMTWVMTGVLLIVVFPVDPVEIVIAIAVIEVLIFGTFGAFLRACTWDGSRC